MSRHTTCTHPQGTDAAGNCRLQCGYNSDFDDERFGSAAYTEPAGIEQAARGLVEGARQAAYGSPAVDFARTGKIWGALLELPEPISPEMVAIMMTGLKLSRLAETPRHLDSRTDGIGYLIALDEVIKDLVTQEEPVGTLEDGFGNFWEPCRPGCKMQISRPGLVTCDCDKDAGTYGPGELPGDEREAA